MEVFQTETCELLQSENSKLTENLNSNMRSIVENL
jgi:hypothetical protein